MGPDPVLFAPHVRKIGKLLRIAVYARYSSDRTETADREFQEKKCVDYYRDALEAESHILFADYGETGTNTDREALQALLEAVAEGKFDVVVVYKFDRISRECLMAFLSSR